MYIIFHFNFESIVWLSESWKMKCMHEHEMHKHRDVDDFLVFEYVCVINLQGWLLWHACDAMLTWEKFIWSPNVDHDEVFHLLKKSPNGLFLHAWLERSFVQRHVLWARYLVHHLCTDVRHGGVHKMWNLFLLLKQEFRPSSCCLYFCCC